MNKEQIEKEFDERFGREGVIAKTDENCILIGFTKKEVKHFIYSQIEKAIKERDEELIKKIKESEVKICGEKYSSTQEDINYGFNQGIDKAIGLINQKDN